MGTIYKTGKFTIRVNGFEHPPIHAHVMHTDGRAMVYLNGTVKNTGVPAAVMAQAQDWCERRTSRQLSLNGTPAIPKHKDSVWQPPTK